MTLLITVVGRDYALACSDLRITASSSTRTRVVDENFNKHILFGNGEVTVNISYTGIAQWRAGSQTIRLYDVISSSLAELGAVSTFGPLGLQLTQGIMQALEHPDLKGARPNSSST